MKRSAIIDLVTSRSIWALAVVTLGMGTSSLTFDADRTIENGFAAALTTRENAASSSSNIVAGSEDYWLRQPVGAVGADDQDVERVLWRGPVAAGGTLVIGDGDTRKEFDVISVEPSSEPAAELGSTRIDMGNATSGALRVQARDGQNASGPAMWLELTPPAAKTSGSTTIAATSGHSL